MSVERDIARPRRPANPAGRSTLDFRLATQPVFRRWMLQRLRQRTLTLPDGEVIDNALQTLNPDDPHGFVPSLIGAWAAVGDILTFYQDRIANEGYLSTATESLSVRALAAGIGYRPRPALSATTHLAFTVLDAGGAVERLTVPKGTAIHSVPPPGEASALFETDQDIEARPEWNAIEPLLSPPEAKPQIVANAVQLRVAGAVSDLRPGTPIVLRDRDGGDERVLVRQLTAVEPDAVERTTLLGWEDPLEQLDARRDDQELFKAPEVLMFRQTARLFGAGAPAWAGQPATVKAQVGQRIGDIAIASSPAGWEVADGGLPPDDVGALAIDQEGAIFAAVGAGVFAYAPDKKAWTPTAPLPQRGVPSVLIAPGRGVLYAGTQRGEVLCSTDRGATWFGLVGHGQAPMLKGAMAALPAGPVRALAVMPGLHRILSVVAGTAFGIWCTSANGGNWAPWNAGLPGYDPEHGTAAVTVNALVRDRATERWIAATDQGLFHAAAFGLHWHAAHALDEPAPVAPPQAGPQGPAAASDGMLGRIWSALVRHPAAPPPDAAPAASPAAAPSPPAPAAVQPPAEPAPAVHALEVMTTASGTIFFAGTEHGVQHSANGHRWHPATRLPGDAGGLPVTHLAAGAAGLLAGTGKGLFQSSDAGATWHKVAAAFAAQPIAALTGGAGRVAAAGAFGGYADTEWPGLLVAGPQIDLDRAYPGLVPGTWIVLAQDPPEGGDKRTLVACKVASASIVMRQGFQTSGRVTRIIVETMPDARFNPRTTTVFIYSRALELFDRPEPALTLLGADRAGPIALAGAVERLTDRPISMISISGRRAGARLVGRAGGVRKWDGKQWTPVGASNYDGQALLLARDGRRLLATKTGVYRLDGNDWTPLGTLNENIAVLAESADGTIVAGGERGVWRLRDAQWSDNTLTGRSVQALLADGARLLAGTDAGLYGSADGGATWSPEGGAVMRAQVTALAADGRGTRVAGSNGGVFVAAGGGWNAAIRGLDGWAIHALAASADGRLYAGTGNGIFVCTDGGKTWRMEEAKALQGDMRALAVHPRSGELHAGRRGFGLATRKGALPSGLANDIRSLAFDGDGILYAGSYSSSVLLTDDGQTAVMEPKFIKDVEIEDGHADLASRLPAGSLGLDLRHIFATNKIVLPQKAEVTVEQSRAIWRIGDGSTASFLLHAVGPKTVRVFRQTDLEVLAPPQPHPSRPDLEIWRLRTKDGVDATLTAAVGDRGAGTPGEIEFAPAAARETVAEVFQVAAAEVAPDRSRTDVAPNPALANVYDAATVSFNANVAPASHGESPALYEVIGSGDNSQPNQSFLLRRRPVTVLATDAAPGYRFEIAISVRPGLPSEPLALSGQLRPRDVDDQAVAWRQVETLSGSGPNDPHYVLRETDDESIVVTFGDGTHGMRLPTGTENVIALYRTGSGPDGNVAADTLISPRRRPAGVRGVTNPVGASGGTPREQNDAIRQTAPITVRTLGRIVAWSDYEGFVRARPGIAKALGALLPLPGRRDKLVHVTFAGADGASPSRSVNVDGLLDAIRRNCAVDVPVRIDNFVPLGFQLDADLAIDPPHEWSSVRDAVQAALVARYGFAGRDLAAPVHAADIIAHIQDVTGVRAVHLTTLHVSGSNPGLNGTLEAAAAAWIDGTDIVRPAELLMLRDAKSIVLNPWTP
jgi:ligand-binding sensor domain-containing protein